MYTLDMVLTGPSKRDYLNEQLHAGKLVIERQGILHQDFCTADGVISVKHQTAGKFYGGGIHQFSWDNVYKNGKLIIASKNIEFIYRYVARHLERG